MSDIIKPELDSVWASEGAKTKPPTEKIKEGWVSEIPPHQYENWVQNRQDLFNAYINQKGVVEWHPNTTYIKDKSFVQDNKKLYVSVKNSGGTAASKRPSLDVVGEWWRQVSFTPDDLRQATGQSTNNAMSQKAVTDALNNGLDNKAEKSVNISAGSGLLGGGNLSSNVQLNVQFGSTAATVAQGNDERFGKGVAAYNWGDHSTQGYVKTDTKYYSGEGITLTGNRFDIKYGTTLGTAAQGNDSRIVNAVPNTRTISAGTGLDGGGSLAANRSLSVRYGTTAGTAAQGNDVRFSNLMPSGNLSENGWTRLPNGLILQWGSLVMSDNRTTTVALPTTFSSNFFNITASLNDLRNGSTNVATIAARPSGLGNAILKSEYSYAETFTAFWFAIGI